jgi:8-oxo-dGTP pyrophosphatase MutT (NUDIX family)
MHTDFENFINRLSSKLREPLPGSEAHRKLSPVTRRQYTNKQDLSKAKPSSVLALFFYQNKSIRLVFIQRPLYNGVHSGQIAFPGGGFEPDDKSAVDTALRETHEEIGIFPDQINVIGKLSNLYIPPSNFLVHPFIGYIETVPEFYPDPREVHEVFSLDIDELINEECLQEREVHGRDYRVKVPCFYLESRLIWGATSMMLSELLEIIRQIK